MANAGVSSPLGGTGMAQTADVADDMDDSQIIVHDSIYNRVYAELEGGIEERMPGLQNQQRMELIMKMYVPAGRVSRADGSAERQDC